MIIKSFLKKLTLFSLLLTFFAPIQRDLSCSRQKAQKNFNINTVGKYLGKKEVFAVSGATFFTSTAITLIFSLLFADAFGNYRKTLKKISHIENKARKTKADINFLEELKSDLKKYLIHQILLILPVSIGVAASLASFIVLSLSSGFILHNLYKEIQAEEFQIDQKDQENQDCPICLENLDPNAEDGSKKVDLRCGHPYHKVCIETWFKEQRTCPECRAPGGIRSDSKIGRFFDNIRLRIDRKFSKIKRKFNDDMIESHNNYQQNVAELRKRIILSRGRGTSSSLSCREEDFTSEDEIEDEEDFTIKDEIEDDIEEAPPIK